MLTTMPTLPDSLIERLRAIARATSGFGTVSGDGAVVEFTVSRRREKGQLEPFEAFVARVESYRQPGDVLVWKMAEGEYTLCTITRGTPRA